MAYRMTEITPQVRIGINRDGEANIEVWTPDGDDPNADMTEVFVPANALAGLARFLQSAAPPPNQVQGAEP